MIVLYNLLITMLWLFNSVTQLWHEIIFEKKSVWHLYFFLCTLDITFYIILIGIAFLVLKTITQLKIKRIKNFSTKQLHCCWLSLGLQIQCFYQLQEWLYVHAINKLQLNFLQIKRVFFSDLDCDYIGVLWNSMFCRIFCSYLGNVIIFGVLRDFSDVFVINFI